MQISSLSRLSGWSLSICAAASVASAQITADAVANESVALDRYVVSASRTPQELGTSSSAVSLVELDQLEARQVVDLRTALSEEPGVIVNTSGPVGGQSSILLRGASSHQTLFIVDGVRMNDRSAAYLNFLSGADLGNIGRIEVLRGPQSTLYGSSAMGGVILIDSLRGCGAPTGSIGATVGSFETYGGAAQVSGGTKSLGYSAAVSRLETANEQPANDYSQWSYSTRVEYKPNSTVLLGGTFRGQTGEYQEPGPRHSPSAGAVDSENYLGTVYAQMQVTEDIVSRITGGWHRREYVFATPFFSSVLSNRREIVDWQNTWQASSQLELVGGANFEWSRYVVNGAKSTDDVGAGYISAIVRPVQSVTVNAGLRYDSYKSAGDATTWRTGAAWQVTSGTKLRATYGTGFGAPGSDDRYGVPQWGQRANPNLRPEKSQGWDLGVDQTVWGGKTLLSATYFQNRFRDLFEWETLDWTTFEGRIINRSRAKTSGVEVAAATQVHEAVNVRVAYTYLEALDSDTATRLIRRPRHTVDADVTVAPSKAWRFGAGTHLVADRMETPGPMEDYTTVRVFGSYAWNDALVLKARVENALDESYEEVLGYPALPRGIYGSVEWRF